MSIPDEESNIVIAGKVKSNGTRRHQIAEVELRYRQLVQHLPAALYTCDSRGYILLYNDAAAELWGREPEIGRDQWCGSWKIYRTDGSPLPLEECPMAVTLKTGKPVRNEEIIIERPDGIKRHILPHPSPVMDASGKVIGATNMLVDITERSIAQENTARLAAIVRSSADAIISKTLKGIVTSWNASAEKIFGYTAGEMIGQPITRLIPPNRLDEETKILERLRKGRHIEHFETKRMKKDGELIDISLTISPIKDSKGKIIGASKVARDITEQKHLRKALLESEDRYRKIAEELEVRVKERTTELSEANRQLKRSNAELEQFAFIASHDLQEPLRKIRAFVSRLQTKAGDALTDEIRTYLDKIAVSATRMSLLINDLLNFSLLTHPEGPFKHTDLNKIINDVKDDFEVLIDEKNARVNTGHLPEIEAIPLQMNHLFHHLISNSLKFASKERSPVIHISSTALSKEQVSAYRLNERLNYYEILVQDNGIGFDQAYARKVFELFQQLKAPGNHGGTGIGLALCKKIVANHKGKIFADSALHAGSVFHVILPVRQS